jgi:phospholipase/carboxylesterase
MNTLHYNILKPTVSVANPPLLLMLHGYGSDENDLFSFAEHLNDRFLVVSVRAPRRLPWGGNAWYDINFTDSAERFGDPQQALQSLEQVVDLLEELKKTYQTSKTVLLGFSQGAILSYALSLKYPERIDAVLALSGYVFKEILPKSISTEATNHLEYFVSHGVIDEVIPVAWARAADEWLTQNKLKHEYKEYHMGHGINPECFQDMLSWIANRYPKLA